MSEILNHCIYILVIGSDYICIQWIGSTQIIIIFFINYKVMNIKMVRFCYG